MALIKVVIGERARARALLAADTARAAAVAAALQKRVAGTSASLASPPGVPHAAPLGVSASRAAVVADLNSRLRGVTVTYKKFGRTYTVPEADAPATPTRQQRKVAERGRRYWRLLGQRRDALEKVERAYGYTAAAAGSAAVKAPNAGATATSRS